MHNHTPSHRAIPTKYNIIIHLWTHALHTSQASPALSDTNMPVELPVAFKLALELAFSMLSFVLRNPTRKATHFSRSTLNPYLTVLLTFLATITKHAETLSIMERSIPWHDLARFLPPFPTISLLRRDWISQLLAVSGGRC